MRAVARRAATGCGRELRTDESVTDALPLPKSEWLAMTGKIS